MIFTIQPLKVCEDDGQQNPAAFPTNVNGVFVCPFVSNPQPSTGKVFLKVVCDFNAAGSFQFKYKLMRLESDLCQFNMGNGSEIDYFRQVVSGQPIYLPFDLKWLGNIPGNLSATLAIKAQQGVNSNSRPVGIKP